jgi:hypothetical protein
MRPIPARHILAVAHLVLFVALVLMGQAELKEQISESNAVGGYPTNQRELPEGRAVKWNLTTTPTTPFPNKVAFLINLPAVLLVELLLFAISGRGVGPQLQGLILAAPFVLVIWYMIGRAIDRRRGLLPARPVSSPGSFRHALVSLGLVLSLLSFTILLVAYTLYGDDGNIHVFLSFLSFELWLGAAAYALWRKLRRWRSPSSTPSELRIEAR